MGGRAWPLDTSGAQGDTRPDATSTSHAEPLVAKGAAGRVPQPTTGPTWGWRDVGTGHKTPFWLGSARTPPPPTVAGARARARVEAVAVAAAATDGERATAGRRTPRRPARRHALLWRPSAPVGGHARDSRRFWVCWRGAADQAGASVVRVWLSSAP